MQFKTHKETITYKNPWYNPKIDMSHKEIFNRYSPEVFTKKEGFSKPEGKIIRVSSIQYDYLVNGQLFTQMGGANEPLLDFLIKHFKEIKNLDNSDLRSFIFYNFTSKQK